MAIGRGSMTKELFGNRQKAKKMATGGMPTPSDMTNQRGRDIADMAQQGGMKMATNAPSRIVPTNPATYAQGTPPMPSMAGPQKMKKGGMMKMKNGGTTNAVRPEGKAAGMPGNRGVRFVENELKNTTDLSYDNYQHLQKFLKAAQKGLFMADEPKKGMKKGGSVRGCGCATRGKSGAKVY